MLGVGAGDRAEAVRARAHDTQGRRAVRRLGAERREVAGHRLAQAPGAAPLVRLLQLVSILLDQWESVGRQTGLSLEYVQRAEAAAGALATAVGIRGQASRSPSADLLQRAYTLMARTYDRVRRMITFLRWDEGDADRIAPSLFRGRSNGRRRKDLSGTDVVREPVVQDALVQGPGVTPDPRLVVSPDLPGAPPFPMG